MFLLGSIPYVASISVNKNVNKSVFKNFDNGWYLYTVDEGGFKWYSSLALDSNNYPHILGTIGGGPEFLVYARWIGTKWEVDEHACGGGHHYTHSMLLDSEDNPHVSYCVVSDYYHLKYATLNGTIWDITNIDYGDSGFAISNSVDIDSQNNPHIAYTTDYYTGHLKYAKFGGYEWEKETVDDTPNSTAGDVDFALDSNDYPHIAYYDRYDEDNGILRYARWNGDEWEKEIVDDSAHVGAYVSLDLDDLDHPYISYVHRLEGSSWWYGNIRYAYQDEQNWIIEEVTTGDTVGWGTSIRLDSQKNPHIAYIDGNPESSVLIYASRINGSWESEIVTSGGPTYPSLILDLNDKPHIGYCDYNSRNLSYATTVKLNCSPERSCKPSGPTSGKIGEEYNYTTGTTDPDGDQVKYGWDWDGDKVVDEWTSFYESGEPVTTSHTWTKKGIYNIRVKAQDKDGLESGWSDSLEVTMPKNKPFNFNYPLLSWLVERFPNAFPILQYILGL